MVLLFALTAFTLRPVSVSTDFAEATANPATTTLTVETSGNAAILDITPSSTTGTFATSDTSDTSLEFSVTTDNITGYNLGISHASATTPAPLTSEDLSTDLASLPAGTSITDSDFNTSTYVGYYGYKPSKLNSEDNSNYIPAPTKTATTLNVTSQANATDASDSYTIALGANIDYTKSAGTYTNTFILTAVANNVAYTINYLDNTGTGGTTGTDVSNLPDPEASSTATATNFTLSSTIPTRTGYDFAGWCYGTVTHNATGNDTCSSSAASDSSAAGDGQTYSAGSTFSFAGYSTSTNVANLYAMWNVKTFAITLAKTNATAIVIDGTSYAGSSVTLTYGTHTISGTYASGYEFSSWSTSNSTNLAITSTTSASTTITVHGAATLTLNGKSSCTAISGYMQSFSPTSSSCESGTLTDRRDNQTYTVAKINGNWWMTQNLRFSGSSIDATNTNINTSKTISWINLTSGNSYFDARYHYSGNTTNGYWYNYAGASAMTIIGSNPANATYDICPKNWRLPSKSEFSGITSYSSAFSPVAGGVYNDGSLDVTDSAFWWSATAYGRVSSYLLRWNGSSLDTYSNDSYFGRDFGFYVRCIRSS